MTYENYWETHDFIFGCCNSEKIIYLENEVLYELKNEFDDYNKFTIFNLISIDKFRLTDNICSLIRMWLLTYKVFTEEVITYLLKYKTNKIIKNIDIFKKYNLLPNYLIKEFEKKREQIDNINKQTKESVLYLFKWIYWNNNTEHIDKLSESMFEINKYYELYNTLLNELLHNDTFNTSIIKSLQKLLIKSVLNGDYKKIEKLITYNNINLIFLVWNPDILKNILYNKKWVEWWYFTEMIKNWQKILTYDKTTTNKQLLSLFDWQQNIVNKKNFPINYGNFTIFMNNGESLFVLHNDQWISYKWWTKPWTKERFLENSERKLYLYPKYMDIFNRFWLIIGLVILLKKKQIDKNFAIKELNNLFKHISKDSISKLKKQFINSEYIIHLSSIIEVLGDFFDNNNPFIDKDNWINYKWIKPWTKKWLDNYIEIRYYLSRYWIWIFYEYWTIVWLLFGENWITIIRDIIKWLSQKDHNIIIKNFHNLIWNHAINYIPDNTLFEFIKLLKVNWPIINLDLDKWIIFKHIKPWTKERFLENPERISFLKENNFSLFKKYWTIIWSLFMTNWLSHVKNILDTLTDNELKILYNIFKNKLVGSDDINWIPKNNIEYFIKTLKFDWQIVNIKKDIGITYKWTKPRTKERFTEDISRCKFLSYWYMEIFNRYWTIVWMLSTKNWLYHIKNLINKINKNVFETIKNWLNELIINNKIDYSALYEFLSLLPDKAIIINIDSYKYELFTDTIPFTKKWFLEDKHRKKYLQKEYIDIFKHYWTLIWLILFDEINIDNTNKNILLYDILKEHNTPFLEKVINVFPDITLWDLQAILKTVNIEDISYILTYLQEHNIKNKIIWLTLNKCKLIWKYLNNIWISIASFFDDIKNFVIPYIQNTNFKININDILKLLKHNIYPTYNILIYINTTDNWINKLVKIRQHYTNNWWWNKNNPLHVDLEYIKFREIVDRIYNQTLNYWNYILFIDNYNINKFCNYDDNDIKQIAYENYISISFIKDFLLSTNTNNFLNIFFNYSYWKIYEISLKKELYKNKKLYFNTVKIPSKLCHGKKYYFKQNLFSINDIINIFKWDSVIFDGTRNLPFPSSYTWFKSYFMILNEILYELTHKNEFIQNKITDINIQYIQLKYFLKSIIKKYKLHKIAKPFRIICVSNNDNMILKWRWQNVVKIDVKNITNKNYRNIFYADFVDRHWTFSPKQAIFDDSFISELEIVETNNWIKFI